MKKNLQDKYSDWYKYISNDFLSHRKEQFLSIAYQASEAILNPEVRSVLEFGIGRGSTLALVKHFGIHHKGVDFNDQLFTPDTVSTIINYKDSEKYDLVCAFQVLEHNPKETIVEHLEKMKEFSNKYIYISVPFSGRWISINININLFPRRSFKKNININWQRVFKKVRPIEEYMKREDKDKYNPHWWEVGDKNLTKNDFKKLVNSLDLKIIKSFHNELFPYHLFYLMEIKNEGVKS